MLFFHFNRTKDFLVRLQKKIGWIWYRRWNVHNSDFQNYFSMSKIVVIYLIFFSVEKYRNGRVTYWHSLIPLIFLSTYFSKNVPEFWLWYQIEPNTCNIFKAVVIGLWSCLFTTKLCKAQLFKWGHTKVIENAQVSAILSK